MARVSVHEKIFADLKKAYSSKYDGSSQKLVVALNAAFADRKEDFRGENLISDKAIRNFFKDGCEDRPQVLEKTLNYLCKVLLNYESYQDALESLNSEEALASNYSSPSASEAWAEPYKKIVENECEIRVLDMQRPVSVQDVYVDVKFLGTPRKQQQRAYEEILKLLNSSPRASGRKNFDKLSSDTDQNIPGLQAVKEYKRLMILGRPGAGKTTLLKQVSLHTVSEYYSNSDNNSLLPIYIRLKDFAENKKKPTLLEAVFEKFISLSGITFFIEKLLIQGRCLLLLDGLDEVITESLDWVEVSIEEFIKKYPLNHFVITCRTATREYFFENFTLFEIAEFNECQVKQFISKWFSKEPDVGEQFLNAINTTSNEAVRDLTVTPLLLTILCWVFNVEYDLPKSRHELYGSMIDTLFKRWDASRRIKRDMPFSNRLTHQRMLDMFCFIAYKAFTQKPPKHIWRRWELEEDIRDFIQLIFGFEEKNLDVASEEILRAVEANTGLLVEEFSRVYSFTHLTFQEYFTARQIALSDDRDLLKTTIEENLINRQWQEVFRIIPGRLRKGDDFFKLMFQQIASLSQETAIQKFLTWLNKVTINHGVPSSGWRALYLAVARSMHYRAEHNVSIDNLLTSRLAYTLREINKDRGKLIEPQPKSLLARDLLSIHYHTQQVLNSLSAQEEEMEELSSSSEVIPFLTHSNVKDTLDSAISRARILNHVDLARQLISLQSLLPLNSLSFEQKQEWLSELQESMQTNLNVGHLILFSEKETRAFNDYLYACNLLADCMRGDSLATPKLRNQILDNLLLPANEIPSELLT